MPTTIITCPVCGQQELFGVEFCQDCAWVFEYCMGELGAEEQAIYRRRLELAQKLWQRNSQPAAVTVPSEWEERLARVEQQIERYEEVLVSVPVLIKQVVEFNKQMKALEEKIANLTASALEVGDRPVFNDWECTACKYVYSEARGDHVHGVAPRTRFESLPGNWVCPNCRAGRLWFKQQLIQTEKEVVAVRCDFVNGDGSLAAKVRSSRSSRVRSSLRSR